MKFFQPQVQLVRESVFDAPDAFYLHVVTFCPRSCFRADGYTPDASELANGLYKVTINLRQDPALPDFAYITPVVHTLALGSLDFPGGEGEIEIQVLGAVMETAATGGTRGDTNPPTTTTKTGGTGTVSTTNADDKSRPIVEDSLFA